MPMRFWLGLFVLAAFVVSAPAARGQEVKPEDAARCNAAGLATFCQHAFGPPPLKFPEKPDKLGFFSSVKMAIYRPEGTGPFPAIVLLHHCAGLGDHLKDWTKAALAEGYVVFVVDSFEQRGLPQGMCTPLGQTGNTRFNPDFYRSRDAFAALQHLARFDFVDTGRVGAMGFSQGGRVAYYLASKAVADVFAAGGPRFRASVSVYGECYSRPFSRDRIRPNIDIPLLALLGDADEDGDPTECVPRLQAVKDKGAPVEWHVFPGAAHAWDQPRRQPARLPYFGSPSGTVLMAYDPKVTEESRQRAFAFLARHLKQK